MKIKVLFLRNLAFFMVMSFVFYSNAADSLAIKLQTLRNRLSDIKNMLPISQKAGTKHWLTIDALKHEINQLLDEISLLKTPLPKLILIQTYLHGSPIVPPRESESPEEIAYGIKVQKLLAEIEQSPQKDELKTFFNEKIEQRKKLILHLVYGPKQIGRPLPPIPTKQTTGPGAVTAPSAPPPPPVPPAPPALVPPKAPTPPAQVQPTVQPSSREEEHLKAIQAGVPLKPPRPLPAKPVELFGQIKAGVPLKPASEQKALAPKPVIQETPRESVLKEIQLGKQLTPVGERIIAEKKKVNEPLSIQEALRKKFANVNAKEEEEEEEEENEEWE